MSTAGQLLVAALVCASCSSLTLPPVDGAVTDAADDAPGADRGAVADVEPGPDAAADAGALDVARDAASPVDAVDAPSPADARDAADVTDVADAGDARTCPGADLQRDPSNCGGCGVQCCGGWCFNGTCGTEGPPGTVGCPSHLAGCVGPVPVQTYADPNNCGACGNACGTGCSCAAGTCRCPSADAGTDAATPDVALDVHVGDLG